MVLILIIYTYEKEVPEMQAHNNNVEEYLSVPRTVFVVPVYQRRVL